MSLTDVLQGVATVAGAGVFIYSFNKLMKEHYIPWTTEVQVEYDKEEKKDVKDYRFSDDK